WMEPLWKVRDRVLDRAQLEDGETLLDVGCGDGLIGFGALDRGAGTVVFSEVSDDLLDVCRAAAEDLGVAERCRFVAARAEDLAGKVNAVFDEIQPESDPMLDFDERDLIAHAEEAGFFPIELELHANVTRPEPQRWEVFRDSSGNPKIPTFGEAMEEALTPEEREQVVAHLRPLVEEGRGVRRIAHAYMRATKPA